MLDDYTKLLIAAAETGDARVADQAVHKLIAHLRSAGRLKMLPQIVRQLREIAARRAALAPHLEVAHEKDAKAALAAAQALGIEVKKAKVNHSLIAGWRVRKGGTLVDHSAKRALIDIYQKVIA